LPARAFSKFDDTSGWARAFTAWHFPVWFRVLVGVWEVSAAILLLVPRGADRGGYDRGRDARRPWARISTGDIPGR
jgi:hypothetical protein